MWPTGNPYQQLATIDDRLANALLIDLEARYNELLDDRNRVAAMLPPQHGPVD